MAPRDELGPRPTPLLLVGTPSECWSLLVSHRCLAQLQTWTQTRLAGEEAMPVVPSRLVRQTAGDFEKDGRQIFANCQFTKWLMVKPLV